MAAYQQVVDDIRMLLTLTEQQVPEQVRRLADLYNTACQETNARLFRCSDLLAKGLRSEAIHFAQVEPILLDAVAVLDFPERRQWELLCVAQGVPQPQPLKLDVATLLNEAYADDQPLEDLLRKHRLLNLGRAPVGSRLALLRRLAELDGRNPAWDEDVRTFERARIQEIQNTLDQQVQQQNATAVLATASELASPKWRIAPPPALVSKAQAAAKRFQDDRTLAALKDLEGKLNDAMVACDVPKALALREQWQQLARGKPNPGDPIWSRIQVVLQWVDQQAKRRSDEQAFLDAVGRLETLLGRATSLDELVEPYAQACKFDRGLPVHVQALYDSVTRRLRFAARLRQTLQIVGPVLAVLLLGSGIAWWWSVRAENARVAAAAETIEAFLEANRFAEATAYFAQLEEADDPVIRSDELKTLKARLLAGEEADAHRRQAFADAMASAQAAGLTEEGDRFVWRAQELAVMPDEQAAVQHFLRQRQAKRTELRQALEKELLQEAEALALKLDELDEVLARPYDASVVAKTVTGHWNTAEGLLRKAEGVDAAVRERIQGLYDRAEAARRQVQRNNAEALAISDLTLALESRSGVVAYRAALQRFVDRFSESERGKAFKQVLDEQDLLEAAFAWQRLIEPIGSRPFHLKPVEAGRLAAEVRQLLEKFPHGADAKLAQEHAKTLEALAQRDEKDPKGSPAEFRRIFGALTVKEVSYLRTEDGKVFYSTDDLKEAVQEQTSGFVPFRYLIGYDGKTKSTSRRVVNITAVGKSSQALLAEEVAELTAGFAEQRWDDTILTYAKKIRASADMDPILKVILLRQVLECGARASYPLAQVLAPHIEELQQARLDITVPWMDPDNEAANKQRPLAREFINQLPSYDPLPAAVEALKQKLADELAKHRVVAGWLQRTGTEWSVASYTKPTDKAVLYVIVPGGSNEPAAWQVIGTAEPGKNLIDPAAKEHLLEGRLVFSLKSDKEAFGPVTPKPLTTKSADSKSATTPKDDKPQDSKLRPPASPASTIILSDLKIKSTTFDPPSVEFTVRLRDEGGELLEAWASVAISDAGKVVEIFAGALHQGLLSANGVDFANPDPSLKVQRVLMKETRKENGLYECTVRYPKLKLDDAETDFCMVAAVSKDGKVLKSNAAIVKVNLKTGAVLQNR